MFTYWVCALCASCVGTCVRDTSGLRFLCRRRLCFSCFDFAIAWSPGCGPRVFWYACLISPPPLPPVFQLAPDAAITGDVIVGFPGETEEQFQHTLDLMERVKFDNLNTFRSGFRLLSTEASGSGASRGFCSEVWDPAVFQKCCCFLGDIVHRP